MEELQNLILYNPEEQPVVQYGPISPATKNDDVEQMRQFFAVFSTFFLQNFYFSDNSIQSSDVPNPKELKLFIYMVSKIKPEDNKFYEVEVITNEFSRLCGINDTSGSTYENLDKTIDALLSRRIWVPVANGRKRKGFHYIDSADVSDDGHHLLKIDQTLAPFLLQLSGKFGGYTKIALENILPLRSKYSIILYIRLSSYAHTGTFIYYTVEQFRMVMGITDRDDLTTGSRIIDKIIKPSLKELNKYTDLRVRFARVPEKGRIKQFGFQVERIKELGERKEARQIALVPKGHLHEEFPLDYDEHDNPIT